MYKVKLEKEYSYGDMGGQQKFWTSEIDYLSSYKKLRSHIFKIKSTCTDLIKFLNLHIVGEEYTIVDTDYKVKFKEISKIDGYPLLELTSDHDLDFIFKDFVRNIKENGISSSIGLLHKFDSKVKLTKIRRYFDNNIKMEMGKEPFLIDIQNLTHLVSTMVDVERGQLYLHSVIDEYNNEFLYHGDPDEFMKRINRENRIRNLLNKDI